MPELPEVEMVRRHLEPRLKGKVVRALKILKLRLIRPNTARELEKVLLGAKFCAVERRGKYLLLRVTPAGKKEPLTILGHLGMTGRMFLQPSAKPLPKHTVVALSFGKESYIFEDVRGFGRFTLDLSSVAELGPEPLGDEFTVEYFQKQLSRSKQPIKVKLLDQSLVAGIGNIYASEALFHARISPKIASDRLKKSQITRLYQCVIKVLREAIELGQKLPLDFAGAGNESGIFYYGTKPEAIEPETDERFQVYDRAGESCTRCGNPIRRIIQAARSTFYCRKCQKG